MVKADAMTKRFAARRKTEKPAETDGPARLIYNLKVSRKDSE